MVHSSRYPTGAFFQTITKPGIPAIHRNDDSYTNGSPLIPLEEIVIENNGKHVLYLILTTKKASWIYKMLFPKNVHKSGYIFCTKKIRLLRCWEATLNDEVIVVTKDGGNLVLPVIVFTKNRRKVDILGI